MILERSSSLYWVPSARSICTINFLTISIRFFLETYQTQRRHENIFNGKFKLMKSPFRKEDPKHVTESIHLCHRDKARLNPCAPEQIWDASSISWTWPTDLDISNFDPNLRSRCVIFEHTAEKEREQKLHQKVQYISHWRNYLNRCTVTRHAGRYGNKNCNNSIDAFVE